MHICGAVCGGGESIGTRVMLHFIVGLITEGVRRKAVQHFALQNAEVILRHAYKCIGIAAIIGLPIARHVQPKGDYGRIAADRR